MTDGPPGTIRQVGPLVAGLVTLAVRFLPPADRNRYDAEFRAELVCQPPPGRTAQALSLLIGAISLRQALKERTMTTANVSRLAPDKNWKCRIGRHKYILRTDGNPENRRSSHLECVRCLHYKEIKEYEKTDGRRLLGGGPA